jgi:hypothetical protein
MSSEVTSRHFLQVHSAQQETKCWLRIDSIESVTNTQEGTLVRLNSGGFVKCRETYDEIKKIVSDYYED